MSTLRDRIDAELENLESSILLLPPVAELPYKSVLEQAGVSGVLHSFYNGIENILKQIIADRGLPLPNGPAWHRDLLVLAGEQKVFPSDLIDDLKQYMAFRHYFSHAYVLDVDPARLEPLVNKLPALFERAKLALSVICNDSNAPHAPLEPLVNPQNKPKSPV